MKYLLDTNICIYLIKQKPLSVINRFKRHSVGDIGISTIMTAELFLACRRANIESRIKQYSKSTYANKLACRQCNHLSLFAFESRKPV